MEFDKDRAPSDPASERCEARTIFWPDEECCDAECMKPRGHDGKHEDEILGEWDEE